MSAAYWPRTEREAILKHARPLAGRDRSADALIKAAATVAAQSMALERLLDWIEDHEDETMPHEVCAYCEAGALLRELE